MWKCENNRSQTFGLLYRIYAICHDKFKTKNKRNYKKNFLNIKYSLLNYKPLLTTHRSRPNGVQPGGHHSLQ
jgi:hypothetical protein